MPFLSRFAVHYLAARGFPRRGLFARAVRCRDAYRLTAVVPRWHEGHHLPALPMGQRYLWENRRQARESLKL